jgi:hypothetical protein
MHTGKGGQATLPSRRERVGVRTVVGAHGGDVPRRDRVVDVEGPHRFPRARSAGHIPRWSGQVDTTIVLSEPFGLRSSLPAVGWAMISG